MGKKNKYKKDEEKPAAAPQQNPAGQPQPSTSSQAAAPSTAQGQQRQNPQPKQGQGQGQQQVQGQQKENIPSSGTGGQAKGPHGSGQQSQAAGGWGGQKGPQGGQGQGQAKGPQGGGQQSQAAGGWGGQMGHQSGQCQQRAPQGHPQQGQGYGAQQRGPPGQQAQAGGQQRQPQGGPQQGQGYGAQQRGPPGQQQGAQQRGPPGQQAQAGGQQRQPQGGPQQGQGYGAQQRGPPGQQQGQQRQPQGGPQQGQGYGQQRGPQGGQGQGQQQRGQQGGGGFQGQTRAPPQSHQPSPEPYSTTQTPSPARSSSSASMSSVSKSGITRGTKGQCLEVETNYLRMNLDNMPAVAYHYDVTITPDKPKKFMRPAVEQCFRQYFPKMAIAFDGKKSCYSVQKLAVGAGAKYDVTLADSGNRSIEYKIELKETNDMEVDLASLKRYASERIFDKPMRALQCLEVVLANPCHGKGIRVGRSFYMEPKQKCDLEEGYEMFLGLFQAAILGDEPFLNVDISHKSFPSACKLTDYLKNNRYDLNKSLDQYAMRDLMVFLRGLNVVYKPPQCFGSFPRTYRVVGIGEYSADQQMFTLDDGTKMSVAQYYQSKNYRLMFPKLNCIQVGSTVKKNYIPMELIDIPAGQPTNKKDGPKQVAKMIRYAATSTEQRKRKIMEMLQHFHHNTDNVIRGFGIGIGANFIQIPMRVLTAPFMEYYGGRTARVDNGSWRNDNLQFLNTTKPKDGHKWAVLYSSRSRDVNFSMCKGMADMILNLGRKFNMGLGNDVQILPFDNIDTTLQQLKKQNLDLVFVCLPFRGTTYADIKQSAELRHGILTQCIKENTVKMRLNPQTIGNILLKLNAKLNGTNHRILPSNHVPLKNVMFLGADVTHPPPDQRDMPSVVGVAASHDANGACYNMQYRLQKSTVENIEDMEAIFSHHLKVYFQYQNTYPDHVIYYRDGVSDGQFPIVQKNELRGIRAACTKVRCRPKITCIIVVKRHHTRFFPTQPAANERANKFNNVPPGTVVDRTIVHPNEVQFFMVSHQSIQGTAKPTRYNVIEDDANMNIDDLQRLTHNMCHLFPRCNRSVSYPTPAYLAHLVAARGKVYIEGKALQSNLKMEYERRLINTNFMNRNPMYFV